MTNRSKWVKSVLISIFVVAVLVAVLFCTYSQFAFSKTTKTQNSKNNKLVLFVPNTLEAVVEKIADQFEKEKNCKIEMNVAGTHVLVTQLKSGASCDIFFSADKRYIDEIKEKKYINSYLTFAKTTLAIVSSSKKVKRFEDVSKKGIKLCIADPVSPIGMWTQQFLNKVKNKDPALYKKILQNVISQEFQITDVIQKVKAMQAEAGVVYLTDAKNSKLGIVPIPDKYNVQVYHYVGVLKTSEKNKLAKDFIEFLSSKKVKAILKSAGYE
ncbi:molybdate ABC transporter substrate-binding protein [Anaerocellum danielii]|uniref:Molybdate ABC transporter substrate-binding protein n=1 Tax=Anaerocellum danielii TaxID=1387557 RepID=A0ABZ0U2G4_9FIRM|nr:molybdate ABC transporter substrate-binding protein [Caldicellulosiruptor danielii]WPX09287.1 molybdate ABC transporter substrate-binding protein [Caldicellulosiruptor danielii]